MTDKFTKGPWTAADEVVVVTPHTHGYSTWIANCAVGGASGDERKANAKLVAAAPSLLEALEALFGSYKQLADSGDAGNWRLEDTEEGKKALAAISSARGEA